MPTRCAACGGSTDAAEPRTVCASCLERLVQTASPPSPGGLADVERLLREQDGHSRSLLRLSKRLELARTYSEVLEAARDEVRATIGYASVWVYLLSDDRKAFEVMVSGGPVTDAIATGGATLVIAGDPMLEEIAAAKDIVVVEDAVTDPRTDKAIVARFGNRTIVNVPIILFDRHLGTVGMGTFGAEGVRVPTSTEQTYLRALASHMAVTLDRLHETERRRQAEAEVRRLNQDLERRVADRTADLEQVNRELEAFAYTVSHDLRAPLRHVTGFIELLRKESEGSLDDRARHHAVVIAESAQRMAAMIDGLLAFSRASRRELVFAPINMTSLCREVFTEVRAMAPTRRIELRVGVLPAARGDATSIRQVLVNLLSNSIKFTGTRAEAVIEVDGTVEGEQATFGVRDNGVGFDMRYVDKLFGVFQRLHRPDEFDGTGIGLAIVKRIVLRHGGRLRAEGILGEGARISFTLPRG